MMKRILLAACITLLLVSCVTNRAALNASASNKLFIGQVRLGQTMEEVRRAMHKGPESQSVSTLPDGTTETVWNYVTDYGNDTNTSITFRADRVVSIAPTHWLGNGNFSGRSEPRTAPTAGTGKAEENRKMERAAAAAGIKLQALDSEHSGGFVTIRGRACNEGKKPAHYVRVRCDYMNDTGEVIDSSSTYASSADAIQPGACKEFELMKRNASDWTKYRVYADQVYVDQ